MEKTTIKPNWIYDIECDVFISSNMHNTISFSLVAELYDGNRNTGQQIVSPVIPLISLNNEG